MKNNYRTECLQALFAHFQTSNISYCVVGDTGEMPYTIPSDIDIVISSNSISTIKEKVVVFAKEQGAQFVQLLQHEQTAFYFVLAWTNDECKTQYLQPDICSDYFRNGKLFFTADVLLNGRRMALAENGIAKGFFVPAPEIEFIYYLIKKVNKGVLSKGQFSHLQDQYKQCPEQCLMKMQQFWPLKESKEISRWLWEGDLTALQKTLPRLSGALAKRCRPSAKESWREFMRKVRRVVQPTGLVIAILGPDGCGKSTIGERLQEDLAPAFRGLCRFHLRPSLLDRKRAGASEPVTNPHGKDARGCLASIAKLLFFFLDYSCGYWIKIRPLKVRSHLVMFDRYYHDMLIDPIRYRYSAPMWVSKFVGFLLPGPDLFLILDAPAQIIQTRKQEVPMDETKRQREAYLSFAQSKGSCIVVNTDQTLDAAVGEARMAVLNYMEKRLKRRMGVV